MIKNELKEKACRILFYLGKGLWKSIPVLGPIVDELIFENFKKQFLGGINHLSEEELQEIVKLMPEGISEHDFEAAFSQLSEDIKKFTEQQIKAINLNLLNMKGTIHEISEYTKHVPMFEEILIEIKDKMKDSECLQYALDIIESKRQAWIDRISKNQVAFLKQIPEYDTPINDLWNICNKIIPSCVYKEFRFRLHEFEWLGLVDRYWKGDLTLGTWIYRRTQKGMERANRNE